MIGFLSTVFSLFGLISFDNLIYAGIAFGCGMAASNVTFSKHKLTMIGNSLYQIYSNWKYGVKYLFSQGKKNLMPQDLQELVNVSKFLPLNSYMMYVNIPQRFWLCFKIVNLVWRYSVNFNWIMMTAMILLYTCYKNSSVNYLNAGTIYNTSVNKFNFVMKVYLCVVIVGFILFSTGFAETLLTTPVFVLYNNDIGACDYYLHGKMIRIAAFAPLQEIATYTCETYSISKSTTSIPIVLSIGDFVMFTLSLILITTMSSNTSEIGVVSYRMFSNFANVFSLAKNNVDEKQNNKFNVNGYPNGYPNGNQDGNQDGNQNDKPGDNSICFAKQRSQRW